MVIFQQKDDVDVDAPHAPFSTITSLMADAAAVSAAADAAVSRHCAQPPSDAEAARIASAVHPDHTHSTLQWMQGSSPLRTPLIP